jgi:hypothetical protein
MPRSKNPELSAYKKKLADHNAKRSVLSPEELSRLKAEIEKLQQTASRPSPSVGEAPGLSLTLDDLAARVTRNRNEIDVTALPPHVQRYVKNHVAEYGKLTPYALSELTHSANSLQRLLEPSFKYDVYTRTVGVDPDKDGTVAAPAAEVTPSQAATDVAVAEEPPVSPFIY